ncbi:MAG: hypothetical protein ACJAT7_003624, partial [Psychromonas sp.]
TNLNVGVYDNDLKDVGQDARSHLRQFSVMNGLSSACPYPRGRKAKGRKAKSSTASAFRI